MEHLCSGIIEDTKAKTLSYYLTANPVIKLGREVVEALKAEALKRGGVNARISLHGGPLSNFHQMLIVQHAGLYYPPHKHSFEKAESCQILEGRVAAFTFDSDGSVLDCTVLVPGELLLWRVGPNRWHTVVPLTPQVVYLESKPGPFEGAADSQYPDWAPKPGELGGLAYQAKLVEGIAQPA